MKEFSLEEYLKNPNREVVTRDGRKVRIICTDKSGLYTQPIVGLITLPRGDEIVKCFWEDGTEVRGEESRNDLFFAPEKHEGWITIDKYPDGVRDTNGIIYNNKSDIPDMPPVGTHRIATIKIEWEE